MNPRDLGIPHPGARGEVENPVINMSRHRQRAPAVELARARVVMAWESVRNAQAELVEANDAMWLLLEGEALMPLVFEEIREMVGDLSCRHDCELKRPTRMVGGELLQVPEDQRACTCGTRRLAAYIVGACEKMSGQCAP